MTHVVLDLVLIVCALVSASLTPMRGLSVLTAFAAGWLGRLLLAEWLNARQANVK